MIKKLKLIMMLLLITSFKITYSQFKIGPSASFILSTITGDNTEYFKLLPSYQFGVIADINIIPEKLSIQPSVLYSRRGTKFNLSASGVELDGTTALNYIDVPIDLVWKVTKGKTNFLLLGGIYFGIGLNTKVTLNSVSETRSETRSETKSFGDAGFNSFDFGPAFGLGVSFAKNFQILAKANIGLTKINDDESDGKIKNINYGLNLSYLFNTKKK